MLKTYFYPIFFAIFLLSLGACKKEENNNVPLTEVYINIVLDDPDYIKLKTVGGWEYITGGSRGIIVYRLNQDQFMAYDRHCTFQPTNSCALVSVDVNNITASDDCCGSSFLLQNGSVSKPPASTALKSYNTSFDGTNLIIRN